MLTARYFDPSSMSVAQATLDVQDEAAARELLLRQGKQLLSTAASRARWKGVLRDEGMAGPTSSEAAVFCSELRALVGAGLSVVEALEALAEAQRQDSRQASRLHEALLDRLRAGRALSSAMRDVGGFPLLLIASVQSSERTSNLPEALDAYLQFDRMASTLARRVVSAALYPGIVLGLGFAVAVFLLWVVMPRFAVLYGQMGQDAGGVTQLLLTISRWLHAAPWAVPVAIVLIVAMGVAAFVSGRWRSMGLALVDAVPLLRRQQRHFELARLFEALGLLVKGGFGVREALALCRQTVGSSAVRGGIEAAQSAVERGQSVSRACALGGLTDAVTVRLLRAGERGGDFATVLHAISRRHATTFETFVERATRLVEPILLLVVALVIGSMVVMLYMPIFDIASSVR